jgi:CDP-glucose 4,6-dehydratase
MKVHAYHPLGPSYPASGSKASDTRTHHTSPNAALLVGDRPTMHETTLLYLDSSKAHRKLGWSAILDFSAALETTVSWYKAQHASGGGDMFAFTTRQIADYEAALVAHRPQVFE